MPILLLFPLQMDSYFSPIRASWILRIVAVAFLRGRCRSRPRFTQHDAVQTLEGRTKYVPLSPKFQSQSGSVDVAYFTSYYIFMLTAPFEFPIASMESNIAAKASVSVRKYILSSTCADCCIPCEKEKKRNLLMQAAAGGATRSLVRRPRRFKSYVTFSLQ